MHKQNELVLAVYNWQGQQHACWGDEFNQQHLLECVAQCDLLVAHNAKYELGWLKRMGADLSRLTVWCTQIAEYVLFSNRKAGQSKLGVPGYGITLDLCARRREWPGKADTCIDIWIKNGVLVSHQPAWLVEKRCRYDVGTTEALWRHQRVTIKRRKKEPVLFTWTMLAAVLTDMEFQGLCLDPERVLPEWHKQKERLDQLEAELEMMAPGLNWKSVPEKAKFLYETLKFKELTYTTGKQRGEPKRGKPGVYKEYPDGCPKTDKDTLKELKARTKRQRRFLELMAEIGEVGASLSKTLDFFRGVVEDHGCIFYGEFNQTVTATGRLSSSGKHLPISFLDGEEKSAQLQNLPRAYKPFFRGRGGKLIGEADYAQLEFRAAAQLSGDEQALADIAAGHDVHRYSASVIFGVPEDEVTDEPRTAAKPHTFKPLYGGRRGTEGEVEYYESFRRRYPKIAAMQERWTQTVIARKALRLPWGHTYYWPWAKVSDYGNLNVRTTVYNYAIQGFATGFCVPIGVICLWHRTLGDKGIQLINTVHDSVVAELAKSAKKAFTEIVPIALGDDVLRYCSDIYGVDFIVPLEIETKIGEHWADKEQCETFVEQVMP